jgi:CRISPR-associated protein Cmr4
VLCYVTSPFILARYAHDLGMTGRGLPAGLPTPASSSDALVAEGSVNLMGSTLVLEDLDLTAGQNADTTAWAKCIAEQVYAADSTAQADLIARFAIVPDDVLSYLSETATELRARIAIDDRTGVVRKGALWYEENLPAETILWGVYALAGSMNTESKKRRTAEELARLLPADGRLLQLGGKAGVGRGLVRLYI